MGYLRPQSKISSKTEPEERSEREKKGSETVGHILQSSIFLPPLPEPGRNLCFLELISLKPRPQEFLTLRVVHLQASKVPQDYHLTYFYHIMIPGASAPGKQFSPVILNCLSFWIWQWWFSLQHRLWWVQENSMILFCQLFLVVRTRVTDYKFYTCLDQNWK